MELITVNIWNIWISKIASFNKASKNVTKARKSLEQAEGLERLSAIDELITALSPAYRYLVVDLLSEIKESDPENETGLLTKYALSFAYVDAIGEFGQGNTQGAIDIFLNVAETEGVSTEDAQEAYMTACYLMSNSGIASPELVLETMRKALALDPNSKMADNIKKSIEYMEGYLTSIAEMDDSSDENADEAEVPSTEVSSENE